MVKSILFWILSIVIMIALATYQRMTGPTYPKSGSIVVGNEKIKYTLPRSWTNTSDARIEIETSNKNLKGILVYRRHPSFDDWTSKPMENASEKLVAVIPRQPAAGKIMYKIVLQDENGKEYNLTDEPVIIRFKGDVPPFVLIPHIFFMFFSMVFGIRTFFEAVFVRKNVFKLALWTLILLFIGGGILGPLVQHYAFGVFWSGWPFGHDLTDNKTLISLIFWIIALIQLKKNPTNYKWAIIASIVMVVAYLIPHSVLGSEIDYRKVG